MILVQIRFKGMSKWLASPREGVVTNSVEEGGVLLVGSAGLDSLQNSPPTPALLSGSNNKNLSTKLSTLALCKLAKLDIADARGMPA
jgi:hypothetical protein